jgi:Ca2+/H+ antiporter
MRLVAGILVILTLLSVGFAHEEGGHAHHHEPYHWQNAEMRQHLLAQLGGMAALGMAVGSYRLLRRRFTT